MTLHNVTKLTHSLVDVAMGRAYADLVIRDGKWVSVQSGEIVPHTDIAIVDGHIAYVGSDASHTIGKEDKDHRSQRSLPCAGSAGCAHAR